MTSVVEITRHFAEARDNQTKVAGTPNDNHIVMFKEDLLNVCLQIASERTNAGDSSGDILNDSRYQVTFATNTSYDRQITVRTN